MDETRKNTIGATVFAILTGLSALFFTAWAFTNPGCSGGKAHSKMMMSGVDDSDGSNLANSDSPGNSIASVLVPPAALSADLDAANAEIKAGAIRRTELAAENAELQKKLKAYDLKYGGIDIDDLKEQVSSLQTTNGALEGKIGESTKKISELEADLEKMRGIKADLDASNQARLNLESKLAAANKAGADWKTKFEAAGKTEADLKTQLAAASTKAEKAEMASAEAGKLRDRITDLEKKLNDIGKEKLALTSKAKSMAATGDAMKQLQGRFDALKKKADTDAKKLADAQKAMSANNNATAAARKMKADLDAANAKAATAEKKLADAQKAMSANAGNVADKMKADLQAAKAKAAAAEKKLADANKAMAAGAGDAAKKLKGQLDALNKKAADDAKAWGAAKSKLENNNAVLQKQIDALKKKLDAKGNAMGAAAGVAAGNAVTPAGDNEIPALDLPLLINDPSKLKPDFKDLFGKLRGIDDTPVARDKLYTELKAAGKSDPSLAVSFSSGSDYINGSEQTRIKNIVNQAEDGAKFLVIGYASKDGSKETNSRLSSRRASNVAKRIADQIGSEDRVQAVYFGDTTRFSTRRLSPNRVVEVWRVK